MSERDWRALAFMVAGETGSGEERNARSLGIVSEGDPADLCPCWEEIRNSGRLECLLGLDEIAACAAHLPRRHPANLALGFPMRMNLDPLLSASALVAAALSAGIVMSAHEDSVRFRQLEAQSRARASEVQERVQALEKNRVEIDSLMRELPENPGAMPAAKAPALRALAAAVPDSLTLARFSMSSDNSFELEAVLTGRNFDQESTRRLLAQNGLSTPSAAAWSFDAASRRLSVRGKFVEAGK
jgi:hypothetical protein